MNWIECLVCPRREAAETVLAEAGRDYGDFADAIRRLLAEVHYLQNQCLTLTGQTADLADLYAEAYAHGRAEALVQQARGDEALRDARIRRTGG